MEKIQEVTFHFFGPIILSYLFAAIFILVLRKIWSSIWVNREFTRPPKAYLEGLIALLAGVCILIIGNFLRLDKLFIWGVSGPWKGAVWILTNFEIFAPIFVTLYLRKQPIESIYIGRTSIFSKTGIGIIVGVVASSLFLFMRGESNRFGEILINSVQLKSLVNFPGVFLEGVAVAFLFVRFQWAVGFRLALLTPSILFAFSHVPGALADGSSIMAIISFFILNAGICGFVLYACYRTKDVIAFGIIHYLMDVTIKAFN